VAVKARQFLKLSANSSSASSSSSTPALQPPAPFQQGTCWCCSVCGAQLRRPEGIILKPFSRSARKHHHKHRHKKEHHHHENKTSITSTVTATTTTSSTTTSTEATVATTPSHDDTNSRQISSFNPQVLVSTQSSQQPVVPLGSLTSATNSTMMSYTPPVFSPSPLSSSGSGSGSTSGSSSTSSSPPSSNSPPTATSSSTSSSSSSSSSSGSGDSSSTKQISSTPTATDTTADKCPQSQLQAQQQGLSLATQSLVDWTQDTPPRVLVPHALYYNSTFAIEIIMGKRWRSSRGITIEDVWRSGTNSYIVLENAPDLRVTSCSRCRKVPQPVVEINASTMNDFGPLPFDVSSLQPITPLHQLRAQLQRIRQTQQLGTRFVCGSAVVERVSAVTEALQRSDDKQLELFCFDNCKTHCTSSRLHLGSRLILVMVFPGNFTSFSEPFELLSKKPRNKRKKESDGGLSDPPEQKPEMTVIQLPTAVTMVPSLLLNPPSHPELTTAASVTVTQQDPPVKSSLLDIAAAVEEEIEANQVKSSIEKQT